MGDLTAFEISRQIASREAVRDALIKTIDQLTGELESRATTVHDLCDEIDELNRQKDALPPDQEKEE